MEFVYFYIFDLVYHMLAHMPVNNASNLYSEEYIAKMREAKGDSLRIYKSPWVSWQSIIMLILSH